MVGPVLDTMHRRDRHLFKDLRMILDLWPIADEQFGTSKMSRSLRQESARMCKVFFGQAMENRGSQFGLGSGLGAIKRMPQKPPISPSGHAAHS
jgi:hypothetical protein